MSKTEANGMEAGIEEIDIKYEKFTTTKKNEFEMILESMITIILPLNLLKNKNNQSDEKKTIITIFVFIFFYSTLAF